VSRAKASEIACQPVRLALEATSRRGVPTKACEVLGHDQHAPGATYEDRTGSEVLPGAPAQGVIFAGPKLASTGLASLRRTA